VHWRSFTEQYPDSTGIFREAVTGILAAVSKQERVPISERTIAGLERAHRQGRIGGRPRSEDDLKLMAKVQKLRGEGVTIREIAKLVGKSPTTITRLVAA
jgi:DNA invertase Pin-like site-specific DNA recombinase